jgi:hypothetical protein
MLEDAEALPGRSFLEGAGGEGFAIVATDRGAATGQTGEEGSRLSCGKLVGRLWMNCEDGA